jgi:multiple sugar transport system substrate-binding protein
MQTICTNDNGVRKANMHFKAVASVAAIGLAALALTGCSSGGDAGNSTTITFWNSFTSDDKPAVEHIVKEFNATHDDVKIDMTIQPSDVLAQKLLPAYSAGKGPTITSLDASQVPQYAKLGVIAPMDDLYSSGKLNKSELPKASLDATMYDGKQYGVPMAATNSMLYYNKDLFEKAGIQNPPTTMDELATDAVKLTQYSPGSDTTNVYGFAIPESQGVSSWAVLLWSQGGSIMNKANTASTLGSDATIKAATYWNDLIQKSHITPVGLNGVQGDSLFGAGRAAMLINGPWAAAGYEKAGVNFGVVSVPEGPGGQFSNAVSVNMHLNSAATDAEKKAANEFFQFWNSKKQQTYWSLHTAYPPNLSTIDSKDIAGNPTAAAFSEAKGGKFYLAGLVDYSKIDGDVMVPTIQKLTNGDGTAETLLPAAAKQIDDIIAGNK